MGQVATALRGAYMVKITELIQRLRQERERLDQAIAVLASLNGGSGSTTVNGARRSISAAGRRRIAAAQRARWAKVRAGATSARSKSASRAKRTMSAAARNRIAAAQRARWAKVRQAKTEKKAA